MTPVPTSEALPKFAANTLIILLCAYVLYLAGISLDWFILHDVSIMRFQAHRMLEGNMPYRDFFDYNFPLPFLIEMACVTFFGDSDIAWRVFELCWLGCTVFAFCFLFKGNVRLSLACGLLFAAIHLMMGIFNAGQRDFLAVIFLISALSLALRTISGEARPVRLFLIGATIGIAFLIKPHFALYAVMLGACLSWNEKLTPARWIRNYACIGIGFSIPIAGMLYWLYHIDALAAFYEIITQFLLQTYGSAIRQTELQSYYIRIIYLVLSSIFVFYYLWQNKKSLSTGEIKTNRLLFASLLYGCLHFVVQHKGWIYHLYPALALVIPCILYNVCLCVRYRGPYMHGHCVVLVFAFLMILVLLHPHSPQALRTEVALVRKNLDRIMHDVTATQKLLPESIENRHSAAFFDFVTFPNIVTRMGLGFRQKYFYSFFLYLKPDHPFTQRMRTEYMQGIRHTMPALIMVGADSLPYAHAFSFAAIDHHIWPEYSAFLEKHYRMAVRNNDYRIYARIH